MQISNYGGLVGAVWEEYSPIRPWTLTVYGEYQIPEKIVYVRFKDKDDNVSTIFLDSIILDVTAPTGSLVVLLHNSQIKISDTDRNADLFSDDASNSDQVYPYTIYLPITANGYCVLPEGDQNYFLNINATDDLSGVGYMMISNNQNFRCAHWEPYTTSKTWYASQNATNVYIKFRDYAGNVSSVMNDEIPRP